MGINDAYCSDCNQWAKWDDLEPREPWNGGYRHKYGTGCWPKKITCIKCGLGVEPNGHCPRCATPDA
jgi:uncharacterized paraquat-inducible protein A